MKSLNCAGTESLAGYCHLGPGDQNPGELLAEACPKRIRETSSRWTCKTLRGLAWAYPKKAELLQTLHECRNGLRLIFGKTRNGFCVRSFFSSSALRQQIGDLGFAHAEALYGRTDFAGAVRTMAHRALRLINCCTIFGPREVRQHNKKCHRDRQDQDCKLHDFHDSKFSLKSY